MRQYMELGSSPSSEDCVQVEPSGEYLVPMKEELRRYKTMLENKFPVPENVQAWFSVKFFPHDFGSYGEVCINYDDDDTASADFAYFVEEHSPNAWQDTNVIEYTPVVEQE